MPSGADDDEATELTAPLAGQIISIQVQKGDTVTPGQELVVLTAMKMENVITAEFPSKIEKILINENENVTSGQVLIEFDQN
jgi:propionyl-CoA carboxylase alpha chain